MSRAGRPLRLHVCVDTGLGRVGVPHREAAGARPRSRSPQGTCCIDGLMMTFTEDRAFDREQLSRFDALADGARASRASSPARRHAASSYTLLPASTMSWLDMVRPGMALFGDLSGPDVPRRQTGSTLRPAAALRARVVLREEARRRRTARATSRAFMSPKKTCGSRPLPVGHADGWPRAAAKGARRADRRPKRYPVIASVSASHTHRSKSAASPRCQIGDVATLWDWQDGSRPEDVVDRRAARRCTTC